MNLLRVTKSTLGIETQSEAGAKFLPEAELCVARVDGPNAFLRLGRSDLRHYAGREAHSLTRGIHYCATVATLYLPLAITFTTVPFLM